MNRGVLMAVAALILQAFEPAQALDALETPARTTILGSQRLLTGLARAGEEQLIAVGARGHVLRSGDRGKTWAQARDPVPVSSDLTAVQFVDSKIGHAVGHGGVVLRTEDGGTSWRRVLDGRTANELILKSLGAAAANGGEAASALLAEAKRNVEQGPDKPFLDVWFKDANSGFVVGAYNLVFRTVDGARTWQSWYDRVDNPKLLNLYAVRAVGSAWFAAGETGLLLKLDGGAERFRALGSPYKGSFFGMLNAPAGVLVFGMRGNVFLSRDQGEHWSSLKTGLLGSVTAGDVAADGRVVLIDQAGGMAISSDGGITFNRSQIPVPAGAAAVTLLRSGVVAAGVSGVATAIVPSQGIMK
jgi:photosystem II stability/assembly factor-like uncharacterized protein